MGIATVRKWQTTFQRPNSTLCSTRPSPNGGIMVREAKIVGLGKDHQMLLRAGIPVALALACPTSALETGSSRAAAVAIHPQCILADRMCQGKDCVYIRDAVHKKWLPMSTKVHKNHVANPNGGKPIFKLLGFYSGPNKIDVDAMGLLFNDGTDKLDAGEDFGSPDPWHNPAHNAQ